MPLANLFALLLYFWVVKGYVVCHDAILLQYNGFFCQIAMALCSLKVRIFFIKSYTIGFCPSRSYTFTVFFCYWSYILRLYVFSRSYSIRFCLNRSYTFTVLLLLVLYLQILPFSRSYTIGFCPSKFISLRVCLYWSYILRFCLKCICRQMRPQRVLSVNRFVHRQFCMQTNMSIDKCVYRQYVRRQMYPQIVLSVNSFVCRQSCPQTNMSINKYLRRQMRP